MKVMNLQEYLALLKAQGVPRQHLASKCVVCCTVQSMDDFVRAGATQEQAEDQFGFSCIGRWTGAAPWAKGSEVGKGCDWTLGGLFTLHKLEVETEDGERHPRFEPATPEEAQAHMAAKQAAQVPA